MVKTPSGQPGPGKQEARASLALGIWLRKLHPGPNKVLG